MQALCIYVEGGAMPPRLATFGRQGGTIGRAAHNTLVLSDAERSVSRMHARVDWRDGVFTLVNMGINPVLCNGRPLAAADEAVLADGDALRIGRFVLRVQRVDSLADPELEADLDSKFDDMTGLPLPRRAGASASAPIDLVVFDPRHTTAPAPSLRAAVARGDPWLAELARGLGCATPADAAALTPYEAGQLLRRAVDEALRAAAGGAGPSACWAVLEQALQRGRTPG